ncbi:MAG: glycosyltransferase [Stigonema ocellatum SAG 48.90 = DSM 106950]|nr:glycosyltransferase [Stigonema ocellatum SAG 48.90 = DSM 106950]
MKIGIDIQALQTDNSKFRGIGRYTQSVVESLLSEQTNHTYHLYANSSLSAPELDKKRFPYKNIDYPQIGSTNLNDLLMKTTMISADVDAVFVPSPMEGTDSTIPDYTDFHKKVFVICYDLIPLIFADRYLKDPNMHSLYMRRLKNVQNADFVFAISESTRQDVIKYLQVSPNKVLNVSGGVSSFFSPVQATEYQYWLKIFADKFRISKKFILYAGGEDWRKNIEGLVTSFAKLPHSLQKSHQLVIACKVSDFFAQDITRLASRLGVDQSLVLTNYVTNEELRALYSTCSLFVFPSFYEGFGLPLLEAISCGAPAIASNTSSLPEILGSVEQQFNPYSPEDTARVMQKVLFDENYRKSLSENLLKQAATFSWQSVAQKMSDVFKEHQPLTRVNILFNRVKIDSKKPQIAFLSPFKPIKSGISDYVQDLLPSVSQYLSIDLYHDATYLPDATRDNDLFSYIEFEERLKSQDYESIIYQLGNSSYHCYIYSQLMRYSGISVLHDYSLGGLINYMDARCPELGVTVFKELEHNYGKDRAIEILNQLENGNLNVNEKFSEAGIYLNRRIFTRSLGVIVHSRWTYNCAVKDFSRDNENIVHIPLVVSQFKHSDNKVKEIHQKLDISTNSFVISTFGFVNHTKRPLYILRAFKKYLSIQPNACLIFVGGTDYLGSTDIEGEINKLSLQGKVKVTGYVNMPEFYRYIEISDICLNLRFPFNGESSSSLLRILSVGKPTIVTDIGSFSDLPNDVVFKIAQPNQTDEVNEILKALVLLTEKPELRKFLSQNAVEYIAKEHSPELCGRMYAEFFEQVQRSPQARRKLLADYVGREAAKVGTDSPKSLLADFAQVI